MSTRTILFRFMRALIDPDRTGPGISVARAVLRVCSLGYLVGYRLRGALHAVFRRPVSAGVPVVSVGNITVGGTGKTPLVAYLAHLLHIRRRRPVILSRGYGHDPATGVDDENLMLEHMAGHTPVVADPNRLHGARTAIERHDADALILDDGFQHRRIARDLDIVLIDAVCPFGGGYLTPRGLLREPLKELRRAGFLLITRADLIDQRALDAVRKRLHALAPGVPVGECRTAPSGVRPLGGGDTADVATLADGRWGAFCGVGNPEAFGLTLRQAGCEPAFLEVFADHEPYTAEQIAAVHRRAEEAGCDGVITTEKDAVKVERLGAPRGIPFHALQTDLDFASGAEALTEAVAAALGERT